MNVKNGFCAAVCFAALSCAACGRSNRAPVACDAARMYRMIEALASDSLEGRRAASGNDMRAARYLAEELREAGCEPLWEEMAVPFEMGDAAERNGMRDILDGEWTIAPAMSWALYAAAAPMRRRFCWAPITTT